MVIRNGINPSGLTRLAGSGSNKFARFATYPRALKPKGDYMATKKKIDDSISLMAEEENAPKLHKLII